MPGHLHGSGPPLSAWSTQSAQQGRGGGLREKRRNFPLACSQLLVPFWSGCFAASLEMSPQRPLLSLLATTAATRYSTVTTLPSRTAGATQSSQLEACYLLVAHCGSACFELELELDSFGLLCCAVLFAAAAAVPFSTSPTTVRYGTTADADRLRARYLHSPRLPSTSQYSTPRACSLPYLATVRRMHTGLDPGQPRLLDLEASL